ncbi:low affinity immunoglobulin gamma Fc region receptor III-like isoform X2 [Macrotis lagotis]|uniref:low affinity immunoglobulin gamma Fc region receptor III-like isoform X2 n=1 Tax=Macrotis lagotis TaxID=92651 RepID=UPI003D68CA6C
MQSALLTFLLLLVLAGRKEASLSKSVVTLHPPWFSVLTNDLVTLRCEGSGSPEDNSTCWYHNDTLIPVQTQNYSFKAYNMTYSGKYQCQKDQSELSEPVRLEVYQDWLLLQTLKLVYMEGEPMVLRCHSWENKFISKITFYKNGIAKQFSPHDFNFSINQVNYDDSGDYYCEANIGNRKKTSKVVRITVQGTNTKTWFHILFYLVMGILFAVDTILYFMLKREFNSPMKNTRRPLTRRR